MSTNTIVPFPAEDNQPPHDHLAEQSVLGALMLSPSAPDAVFAVIAPGDFWDRKHVRIAEAILDLHRRDEPADPVTVCAELERSGDLERCGGGPYLLDHLSITPNATHGEYYAKIVREKADLRQVVTAGVRLTQRASSTNQRSEPGDPADLSELLSVAQKELDAVADRATRTDRQRGIAAMSADHLQHLDDLQAGCLPAGLPTGIADLDDVLAGGLRPGQLVTVAGRPGEGKSTLAMDIARHAALHNGDPAERQPVMFFSLEMSERELWGRVVCAEARVRHSDYSSQGRLSETDRDRIDRKIGELTEPVSDEDQTPLGDLLLVDDTARVTPSQIRALARQQQRRTGLALIVVDYLQLMSPDSPSDNREREVASITRELKLTAKALDVPVVMLSQLNRKSTERADKRPMLSDLRESGALEQDSDIVVLLHQPASEGADDPRVGESDLLVAKNRGGPTSTVAVAQQLHYCRFSNLARG